MYCIAFGYEKKIFGESVKARHEVLQLLHSPSIRLTTSMNRYTQDTPAFNQLIQAFATRQSDLFVTADGAEGSSSASRTSELRLKIDVNTHCNRAEQSPPV